MDTINKVFKKKIKIILIFFSVFAFSLGFLVGNNTNANNILNEQKTNNANSLDLSQLFEVKNIMEESFIDTRPLEYREEITLEENAWGVIRGFVESFQDPFTVFLLPEQSEDLEENIVGEFVGVGIEIINKNNFITVISPLSSTPAYKAGIKPKDVILKIDDIDAVGMSTFQAANRIRGEKGTEVILTIGRKGEVGPIEIVIIRDIIKIPTIETIYKDGVFVIKLHSFSERSPHKFIKAIIEFIEKRNDKLIIDLRGNSGGHLFAAVYMAGIFLPENSVVLIEDYGDKKEDVILRSGLFHGNKQTIDIFGDNLKLAILVDGGSASASEILAGSLSSHDRAIIMGTTTFGKGTVQQIKNFPDGSALKYTIAKWVLPNGKWVSSDGIIPDIEIKIEDKKDKEKKEELEIKSIFANEVDPQLQKAIDELNKIKTTKDFRKKIKELRENKTEKERKEREEKIKKLLEN